MIDRVSGQTPAFAGATAHAGLVFTAGVIAPSVLTGHGAGFGEQAREVMAVLDDVLGRAGSRLDRALRVEAFLAREQDLAAWNEVFARTWPSEAPARSTVLATLAVPGALIEIQIVGALTV
ncbi:regulator [Amycolatopsis sp. K13G38]|uniref:Regulator n=1 Tax=Amycolatopsis acididurans TaxID=2724524 RepID=A0ABX1J4N8_9PSEU|nr:Rid family hydrolase [Amycolatopsis acididurans]NKQ54733.1 regulator [Amycolatopsis acididurans]